MKKLIFLFAVALQVFVAQAYNNDKFEYEGLKYKVVSENDNTVEVGENDAQSVSGKIEIPAFVTYNGNRYLVTGIGWAAFRDCKNLTDVTIPNSVTIIDYHAFEDCSNLEKVTMPNSVVQIKAYAFTNCSKLESFPIPDSVTTIEKYAFSGCSHPASVDIPNSVTTLGEETFSGCSGLTSVTIPKSLKAYEGGVFASCENLRDIIVEDGNKNFCSENGVLYDVQKTILYQYPAGNQASEFVIPQTVTTIDISAFRGSSNLISLIIPTSVKTINRFAFMECAGLNEIIIPGSVTTIDNMAFEKCQSLTSVTLPASLSSLGYDAFEDCVNLKQIVNYSPAPVSDSNTIFEGTPTDAVVYVPKGSYYKYMVANGWSYFSDYREMDEMAVLFGAESITLAEEESATINAVMWNPDYVAIKSREWSSSDPEVATVADGVVTAKRAGSAVITCKVVTADGKEYSASCSIHAVTGAVDSIVGDGAQAATVYTLNGLTVGSNLSAEEISSLAPGIYIVLRGMSVKKIVVR